MYQVPSEFIRQKTTVVWFVTVEHAIAAFLGYLLGEALGGGSLTITLCVALGLALTTIKIRGLTLYRFLPLAVTFLLRRLAGGALEPEDGPVATTSVPLAVHDAEGRPIVFQEE